MDRWLTGRGGIALHLKVLTVNRVLVLEMQWNLVRVFVRDVAMGYGLKRYTSKYNRMDQHACPSCYWTLSVDSFHECRSLGYCNSYLCKDNLATLSKIYLVRVFLTVCNCKAIVRDVAMGYCHEIKYIELMTLATSSSRYHISPSLLLPVLRPSNIHETHSTEHHPHKDIPIHGILMHTWGEVMNMPSVFSL